MAIDESGKSTVTTLVSKQDGTITVMDELHKIGQVGAMAVIRGDSVTLCPRIGEATGLTFSISQLASMRDVLSYALDATAVSA